MALSFSGSRVFVALACMALGAAPARADSTHAPGATITDAAVLDVTDEGFSAVAQVVPGLMPESFEIPATGDSGNFVCDYWYSLSDAWVGMEVAAVEVVPVTDSIEISVDLLVWVNTYADTFSLVYGYDCSLWDYEDTCYGYVEPFYAYATLSLSLLITEDAEGNPALDVTMGEPDIDYDDLTSDDIVLEDCSVSTLETVLNVFSVSLYDWVLDYADAYIEEALTDMTAELETTLEDAFSSAVIDEQFEVLDTVLSVYLAPSAVALDEEGMRLYLDGAMDAGEADACIADWDPGGSRATATSVPALGDAPTGVDEGYHADVLLSDDIANQALYGLWRSGLLCYTIDEDFESFTMSTSMLSLMGTDAFDEIFPESEPLVVVTRPRNPPEVNYTGSHDLDVEIESLGVDFFGEVDGRQALVLGLDVDALVGGDVELDGATGYLDVYLDLDADNIDASVRANELVPDATEDVEEGFSSLLDQILGMFVGSDTLGYSLELSAYEGLGLTALEVGAAGSQEDWLGAYAEVGSVSYEGSGCSDTGDTGEYGSSEGCDSGCGVTRRSGSRWLLLPLAALVLGLRRRR